MGVSISIHVYPLKTLLPAIEKHVQENGGHRPGALPVREWFGKIAPEFGNVSEGKFYVLWNEYYEKYNPASNFLSCVDDYYFPNHEELGEESERGYWDTFWADDYESIHGGVTSEEVLASVFPDEFDEDGEYNV